MTEFLLTSGSQFLAMTEQASDFGITSQDLIKKTNIVGGH